MKEIKLEARRENLRLLMDMLSAELEQLECPIRAQMQIELAVDEAFTNIASYAYAPGSGEATVRFEYAPETGTVTLTFRDSGVPYDPLKKEDPDVTLPAAQRKIGGLGIFLIKKNMDAMRYARQDGQNVLTLTKKIS